MNDIHLLWTGGWDSTYRILDLVLINNRSVKPFYIVDTKRPSFSREIQTMVAIKQMIYDRKPDARALILPTEFTELNDIQPIDEISQKYKRLLAKRHLGSQYDWLARFAIQRNINDLELCIHADDKAHYFLQSNVRQCLSDDLKFSELKEDLIDTDLGIFQYFRYPLFIYSKLDIQRMAHQKGFVDIMEKTWFCYTPIHGKPCGKCAPCDYTIEEGLWRRMPILSLIRWMLYYRPKKVAKNIYDDYVVG